MIQFTEEQDKAAREWNEAFDYRALRNGVQCGNILMLHLDEVNKRAMELYAAQQVAAERERIKELLDVLDRIAHPIARLQEEAKKEGMQINGMMATMMTNDPNYYKNIASDALKKYTLIDSL